MNPIKSYFFTGAGLGVATAVIGAAIDWMRMRRLPDPNDGRLPGCMMLAVGALGFLGVVMIIFTWILSGSPRIAIWAGLGVIVGFFLAFAFLAALWLLGVYRRARGMERN